MKKIGALLMCLILISFISPVIKAQTDDTGLGQDAQQIENIANQLPFDEQGNVDAEKFQGYQTAADRRIAVVNAIIKPISKFIFGFELELGWHFVYVAVLILLVTAVIALAFTNMMGMHLALALPLGFVVSLFFIRFTGERILRLLDGVMKVWWYSLIFVILVLVITSAYSWFMKKLGKAKKEKDEKDEEKEKETRLKNVEKFVSIEAGDI